MRALLLALYHLAEAVGALEDLFLTALLRQAPRHPSRFHHKDCGTAYRGCHPTKCPKDQYEQTGVWKWRPNQKE